MENAFTGVRERVLSIPPATKHRQVLTCLPTWKMYARQATPDFLMAVDICSGKIGEMVVNGSAGGRHRLIVPLWCDQVSSTSNDKGEKYLQPG
jgi:hypothetical protein